MTLGLTNWDWKFLEMARLVASWSKDPSTQTGAVIVGSDHRVVSTGYNGFPMGMNDDVSLYNDRETKYSRMVHCEMNALIFAGSLPAGCSLYTHPCISCDRCMIHMIQAGIRRFVAPKPSDDMNSRWAAAFERTRSYAAEVGALVIEV